MGVLMLNKRNYTGGFGGGGEPGEFDSLYGAITTTGSYTLSASIDNYDAVLVVGGQISGNNRSLRQSTLIPKANYYDVGPNGVGDAFAVNCSMWSNTYRVMFGFSNNTTILVREVKDVDIIGVYGLKLGSGGGGGGYTKDTLWSGNEYPTTSGTTITLNGNISDYDEIYVGVKNANYGGDARFDPSFMTIGENYICDIYYGYDLGPYFTYVSDTQIKIMSQSSSQRQYYTHVIGVKY